MTVILKEGLRSGRWHFLDSLQVVGRARAILLVETRSQPRLGLLRDYGHRRFIRTVQAKLPLEHSASGTLPVMRLVGRQTSVMIVRCAEIVLVDASGGEAAMPRQRLSIRRRAGDRRERAGGRAEERRGRFDTGYRGRHAEGGLVVAGRALGHAAVGRLARPRRPRVLLALQHLDEVAGGLQGVARQQRALVVHGHGDLPGAGGLLEGRGSTAAVGDSAADGVLTVGFDLDRSRQFLVLVRLVLRRDHR